jgi:hypothetical protein
VGDSASLKGIKCLRKYRLSRLHRCHPPTILNKIFVKKSETVSPVNSIFLLLKLSTSTFSTTKKTFQNDLLIQKNAENTNLKSLKIRINWKGRELNLFQHLLTGCGLLKLAKAKAITDKSF